MMDLSLLPFWLKLLLLAGLVVLGAPFLLGPLLLKSQHRIRRNFRLGPPAAIPDAARERIEADRPVFEQADFDWLGFHRLSEYAPGSEAFFGLWRHREHKGLAAMSAVIYQQPAGGEPVLALSYAELSGRFEGGFSLCVSNSPQPGAFDQDSKLNLRYPGKPIDELLRVYRAVAGRDPRCRRYDPVPPGQETQTIRLQMLRELDTQVSEGLYRLDGIREHYQLTWTGAIVMTMRHLPPFAWLRNARDLRTAARWAAGS